jgi:hypothetical protein
MLHPKPSRRLESGSWDLTGVDDPIGTSVSRVEGDYYVPQDQAERIVVRFLRLCEHPLTSKRTLAMVKSVIEGDETGMRVFRLVNLVTGSRPATGTNLQQAIMRRMVIGVLLAGVGMGRYLRHVEPFASASEELVVTMVAPSIRAALDKQSPEDPAAVLPEPEAQLDLELAEFEHDFDVEPTRSESWFDDFDQFEDETMVLPLDR